MSREPIWHLLVLVGGCLFFCDVFNRRVVLSLAPVTAAIDRVGARWRKTETPAESVALDRLRARKHEVGRQIEERLVAARFEPPPSDGAAADVELISVAPAASPAALAEKTQSLSPEEEEVSYTTRLLRAKRNARGK